jgi:lipopolysaccharide export system permease protein
VYSNGLTAARTWLEKGVVPPAVGLWWIHALVLVVALWLLARQSPPSWLVR